jgi:3-hydroxyacyl-CoA dehydrogenase/enoyl-CoA hydratase/3-hydroxybutyryl-CoA epimerase
MIENVARMAGMPVGPLSLNDEVAIDLALKIVKATKGAGRRGGPSTRRRRSSSSRWSRARAGSGRKNKKGFYDYPESGPKRLWPGLKDLQATQLDPDTLDVAEMKSRLLVTQALEAARTGRGGRDHRSARGRCRLDPRLRLRALHRRALSYIDFMGAQGFLACASACRRSTATLRRAEDHPRHGGERRHVLRPRRGRKALKPRRHPGRGARPDPGPP